MHGAVAPADCAERRFQGGAIAAVGLQVQGRRPQRRQTCTLIGDRLVLSAPAQPYHLGLVLADQVLAERHADATSAAEKHIYPRLAECRLRGCGELAGQ